MGNIWEDNFNPSYTERISLSVSEMRYIASMLRLLQGKPARMCFTPQCCETNVENQAREPSGLNATKTP